MPAWIRRLPAVGLCVWLAVAAVRAPAGLDEANLAELIVVFLALCAAPLAISQGLGDLSERTWKIGATAWAVAAGLLAVGVVTLETGGAVATALACGWLVFAAMVAAVAAMRLLRRRPVDVAEGVLDVGLMALVGAAGWLVVYRGDLVFAGFGGLAAVLTAAHFHAAGFGSLVMAGLVGRGLRRAGSEQAQLLHGVVAAVLVVAFAGLAAGIATGIRAIEVAGAGLYAIALPALAGLQIFAATRVATGATRGLLVLSSLALLVATSFALMFAAQGFYGSAVPIATMLRMHGAVNAFGFLGLGLWGWSRASR